MKSLTRMQDQSVGPRMRALHAREALLLDGFGKDVRLVVEGGLVVRIETGVSPQPGDERHTLILPGMPNLHSHAFQRAMAGLAERRGPGADSFWSWREAMYRVALSLRPDEVEAVAALLYAEMLEAGFTRVGEFHYLHHDATGSPYADPAEMALRIAAAADETGIALTLLPVFYAHAGFGGRAPVPEQRRFVSTLPLYERMVAGCRALVDRLERGVLGIAPHSLRAVTPDELAAVVALAAGGPIHLHVAEQVREVEDCVAATGARPVEWLLANQSVDRRWCLIHATHMLAPELRAFAHSGAVAGLCPITEANLGDGIFPHAAFQAERGRFGIGSDSNVLIGLADELRQLEYAQRLSTLRRNVLAGEGQSSGRSLFDRALAGGHQALGSTGGLVENGPADCFSLADPLGLPLEGDQHLDNFLFTGQKRIDCVWVGGRKVVTAGRHHARERIEPRFRAVMARLLAA